MPSIRHFSRGYHLGVSEQRMVAGGNRPPRGGPLVEILEFYAKNRPLNPFQPIVIALQHVIVFFLRAPVSKHPDGSCELRITRHHHASLAVCAQVLARIEAEAGHIAHAAAAASFVLGAVSLGRVFDHQQIPAPRNL